VLPRLARNRTVGGGRSYHGTVPSIPIDLAASLGVLPLSSGAIAVGISPAQGPSVLRRSPSCSHPVRPFVVCWL